MIPSNLSKEVFESPTTFDFTETGTITMYPVRRQTMFHERIRINSKSPSLKRLDRSGNKSNLSSSKKFLKCPDLSAWSSSTNFLDSTFVSPIELTPKIRVVQATPESRSPKTYKTFSSSEFNSEMPKMWTSTPYDCTSNEPSSRNDAFRGSSSFLTPITRKVVLSPCTSLWSVREESSRVSKQKENVEQTPFPKQPFKDYSVGFSMSEQRSPVLRQQENVVQTPCPKSPIIFAMPEQMWRINENRTGFYLHTTSSSISTQTENEDCNHSKPVCKVPMTTFADIFTHRA